jgi:hypothetical protein
MISLTRPDLLRTSLYFTGLYLLFGLTGAPAPPPPQEMMMPQAWAVAFLAGHPDWNEALRFFFVAMTAFALVRLVVRHSIYLEQTFLPALIYLSTALGCGYTLHTPLMALVALLLVYAVDHLILSHKQQEGFGHFLQAAVALGVMPLLYAPTVVFVLLLPMGLVLFRQSWRSAVTSLIGCLFPLALCCYIGWGMKRPFLEPVHRLAEIVVTPVASPAFSPGAFAIAALFAGLTVWSLVLFILQYKSARSRTKRGTALLIWTWVASLLMATLPGRSFDMLPIAAVPLAGLIPGAFVRMQGWIPNVLILILFLTVIGYSLREYLTGLFF